MAINLNLKTYGDQFRAFVNFANANANDADTLACIEGDKPGGLLDPDGNVRAIVAKTDDDKIKAVGNAFDADGIVSRITPGGNGGGRIDYINVTKDEAGNITIQSDTTFNAPGLIVIDGKKKQKLFMCDGDSSMSYHLKVTVGAESLDRFGGADWKNYDREAIRKIENDQARPHRLEEAANALPEDTKLDVDVDVSFGINVDNFVM